MESSLKTSADARKKVRKVIWLRRNERLPDISPAAHPTEKAAPQDKKNALYVRANPAGAKHKDQFIYVKEPKIPEERVLPTPNLVMLDIPVAAPPSPPKRREFMPPKDRPRLVNPVNLQEPRVAENQDVRNLKQSDALGSMKNVPKAPTKAFVPPSERPRQPLRNVDLDEPSGIATPAATVKNPQLMVPAGSATAFAAAAVPARKKMDLPASLTGSGGGVAGSARVGALEEPSLPSGSGQSGGVPGEIAAVIISANPLPNGRFIQPQGNRSAEINSGAASRAGKGDGNGSGGANAVVPGLSIRNGGNGISGTATTKSDTAAEAAPTPARPAYRPRLDTASVSIPQWPSTRRVPFQVEAAFPGRPVYSTVIPGGGDSPDWIMWFGELQPTPMGTRIIMRPPQLNNAAARAEALRLIRAGKCWVKAKLGKDGKLNSVQISQDLGAETIAEFTKVLQKWLWTPAIRNGEAVEVDVVMEVELKKN